MQEESFTMRLHDENMSPGASWYNTCKRQAIPISFIRVGTFGRMHSPLMILCRRLKLRWSFLVVSSSTHDIFHPFVHTLSANFCTYYLLVSLIQGSEERPFTRLLNSWFVFPVHS